MDFVNWNDLISLVTNFISGMGASGVAMIAGAILLILYFIKRY